MVSLGVPGAMPKCLLQSQDWKEDPVKCGHFKFWSQFSYEFLKIKWSWNLLTIEMIQSQPFSWYTWKNWSPCGFSSSRSVGGKTGNKKEDPSMLHLVPLLLPQTHLSGPPRFQEGRVLGSRLTGEQEVYQGCSWDQQLGEGRAGLLHGQREKLDCSVDCMEASANPVKWHMKRRWACVGLSLYQLVPGWGMLWEGCVPGQELSSLEAFVRVRQVGKWKFPS